MGADQIFIVDPNDKDREAYGRALREAGYAVEASAAAEGFLRSDAGYRAVCLITDLRLRHPGMGGIAFLEQIAKGVAVVVVGEQLDVRAAAKAMRSGAVTVLEKPVFEATLVSAVQEAVQEGRQRRRKAKWRAEWDRRYATLSPREVEVLDLVVDGKSMSDVASLLSVSIKTAEFHRQNMMKKLSMKSVVLLARAAFTQEIEPE